MFFDFFSGPIFFRQLGARVSLSAQTLQTPVSRDFSKNSGEATQRRQSKKVVQRKHGPNEPKKSRKIAGGAELRPNSFLSVGSLTDKTGLQPSKWPPDPPKTAISQAPGSHGTPNRVQWVRI